jgi:type IV pilus assembly protein PilF
MLSVKRFHKGFLWTVLLFACSACASMSNDPLAKYSDKQLEKIGQDFLAARDFGQGLRFLTAAAERRPNDPKIQYMLGVGYDERGLEVDALAHYQRALQLKPDYSEVNNALGSYYARKGMNDKAEEEFKKALANPFYETPQYPLYNLGLLYEQRGDTDEAMRVYSQALRLAPTYGIVYYRMGLILEKANQADKALEAYGLAIKYDPNLAQAHLRYGIMSYMTGDLDAARYSLNRVVKIAPESSLAIEARRYLARMRGVMESSDEQNRSTTFPTAKMSRVEIMKERDLLEHGSGAAPAPASLPAPPKVETQKTPAPLPQPAKSEATETAGRQPKQASVQQTEAPKTPAPEVQKPRSETAKTETDAKATTQKTETAARQAEAPKTPAPEGEKPQSETANANPETNPTAQKSEATAQQAETTNTGTPEAQQALPGAPSPETAKESPPPEPQFKYIVQVGSFADKQTAEAEGKKLKAKGYNAVVKSIKHKVLGHVYVIQLKPVNTPAQASTLMTQLEGAQEAKPVLIKLPAD